MKEFYVSELNQPITGPFELVDAINSLSFYVSSEEKARAMAAYINGTCYHFNFSYGFNNSATVTIWLDKIK